VWSKGGCADLSRKEKEGYKGRIGRGKGVGRLYWTVHTERALRALVVERDWTVCVGTSTFFSIRARLGVTRVRVRVCVCAYVREYVCVRVHVTRTCAYVREYVREYVCTRLYCVTMPLVPCPLYRPCLLSIASAIGLCVRAIGSAVRCCCA
jgi:hypothetical protein